MLRAGLETGCWIGHCVIPSDDLGLASVPLPLGCQNQCVSIHAAAVPPLYLPDKRT